MLNNNKVPAIFKPRLLPAALSCISCMSVLSAPQAFAENGSPKLLEEVVVLARRREESLQQVPQAVTAITREDMRLGGVSNLSDLQAQVPGLTVYPARATSSTVTAYIRGVGQSDPLWGVEPGVGIYIDDVYLARPQGALLEMLDVERVEVLRGPQGTLYGRNTIGGAIKYVNRPIPEETEMSFQVAAGSYSQRDYKAAIRTPITDTVFASATLGSFERDGYGVNRFTGADVSDKQLYAGRVALEWRPDSDWSVGLSYDAVYDRSAVPGAQRMIVNVFEPFFSGMAPLPVSSDRYDVDNGFRDQSNDTDTTGASVTIEWTGGEHWSFKSITAQREGEFDQAIDFDVGPYPIVDVDGVQSDDQLSQEFQWQYRSDRLNGVFGLYYMDANAGGIVRNRFGLPTALVAPGFESILGPTVAIYGLSGGEVETDAAAIFADVTYDINDKLSLNVGARFNREKKRAVVLNQTTADAEFMIPAGPPSADFDETETWTDFSPRVGLDYQLSDDAMVYASYSEGFKSGGFNIRANTLQVPDSGEPYKPERVESYELGIKADLSNDFRLNVAAFYSDYTDIQLSIFTGVDTNGDGNNDGFFGDFTNAGAGVIQGFELEYIWVPSEHFALSGNATWLDASYDEYISAGVNVADEQEFTNTPELAYTINADFSQSIDNIGAIDLRISYNYRDDVYPTTDLSEILRQDDFGLWNAALVLTPVSERWTLTLEGKNLTDEEYRNTGYDLTGSGFPIVTGFYGAPRTWTLRLSLDI